VADNSEYHWTKACYVRLGRPAEAVADYREAFRMYPDAAREPLHLIGRAKALLAAGEYEAALADLDEAVRLKPEADEAYQLRADCHLAVGACDRAVEEYSEAIRRHGTDKRRSYVPMDPKRRYHVNRGLAYLKLGETEKAVEDFTTAITLANAGICSQELTASAVYNRGWAYLKAGDALKAVEDFTTAVRLQPGFVAAYEGRAAAHRAGGDAGAADADDNKVQELKTAAARSPGPAASTGVNWGEVGTTAFQMTVAAAGLVFLASAAVAGAALVGSAAVMVLGAGGIAQCRHCGEEMNPGYTVCHKCGRSKPTY
jgi:tetratricopeptide (TPR) repeat protein